MADNAETARLMRLEVVALMTAVDDLEADRYTPEERRSLASGLEKLVTALRAEDHPVVIDQPGSRQGALHQRPGLIEWGSIS